MAMASIGVDIHNVAVAVVNHHSTGVVCVTFGDFPTAANLYFKDAESMVTAAMVMLREAGLWASWEIDLLLGYQPEPTA